MIFGLKDTRGTFRHMVDKIFKDLIERTMEVYVNDKLVKSTLRTDHLQHLGEAFDLLWKYKIELNLEKYTFGGCLREVLSVPGYSTGHRGWPQPDIRHLQHEVAHKHERGPDAERAPRCPEPILQPTDKCKPFFQALKKSGGNFRWNE